MANSSHRIQQGHDARCAGEDRQSPAQAPAHRWHSTWGHQRGNCCVHTLGQRSLLLLVLLWLDPRTGSCPVASQRRALKGGGVFRHFDCPQQKGPETDPYFVSLLDYDGVLDGRGHRPCSDLFLRRTQALQCQVLQQPSWWHAAPVSAEVCNLPGGDVLVSILTPTDMHAWFHAHLVGPQVMSPPLSTCSMAVRTEGPGMDMVRNANSYHAATMFSPQDVEVDAKGSIRKRAAAHQLLVTDVIPGDYELSLRVVYLNFSYSRDRNTTAEGACGDPVWRVPLHINATTGSSCTYCAPQPQSWPVCSSPSGEGTVLFTKREGGLQIPETMGRSWSLWRDTLQWQPKGCNFVPREKIDLPQCFKDRMVCFVGDSHMRYAHNGVVDALKDQGWREANTTGFHGIFEHNNTRLVWNVWAEMPRFDRGKMFEGCTDILMGFAAWPLGKPPAYRWTAGHYVQMMTESFQWASNWLAQNPSRRAYFMPTSLHRILCDNPLELRNPPYVRLFNQLSMMLAGLHRIPVIDTETITGAMFDLAHDDVHHHWIGFSGHTIVDFILNVLCVQPKPQLR